MKKILLLLVLLLTPTIVNAESVNYKITDFYVDAEIDIAGSMNVKELLVMEGTFNGYERDIIYKNTRLGSYEEGDIDFSNSAIYNGSGITNVEILAKYIDGSVDFNTFKSDFEELESVRDAKTGDSGVYIPYSLSGGMRYRMYYPANNKRVAFLITYTVTNVVVIHEDVAEVYWQFMDNFEDDIKNVNIRLVLPEADSSDYFRLWAHGNLHGEISYVTNSDGVPIGSFAEIKDLKSSSVVDIRMTFDKSLILIEEFAKHSNQAAFDKILEVEEVRAEEANTQRQAIKVLYYGTLAVTIIYLVFLILLWIYTYLKYDKEHKSSFKSKYYREFIEDYSVEVIDYLFKKNITPNAMSASIMNLIYRKNFEVQEIEGKKKDYCFKLLNKEKLTDSEEHLVDFLFLEIGNGSEFTTIDMKKYAGGTLTYSKFTTGYEKWKNLVKAEGLKQNFFESNTKIKIAGSIYATIGFGISYYAVSRGVEFLPAQFMFILSLIFMIYILMFSKRTKKGNEDYLKWSAFKRFLLDFSILPKRELPEIRIWERYMVYATVLGVARKVSASMNVRINEMDPSYSMHTPLFNTHLYMNMSSSINHAVSTAIRDSVNKSNANSASSSGGGFGGGFSSGGGFGGGGGGGRGF